jgi:hypothetical protein
MTTKYAKAKETLLWVWIVLLIVLLTILSAILIIQSNLTWPYILGIVCGLLLLHAIIRIILGK